MGGGHCYGVELYMAVSERGVLAGVVSWLLILRKCKCLSRPHYTYCTLLKPLRRSHDSRDAINAVSVTDIGGDSTCSPSHLRESGTLFLSQVTCDSQLLRITHNQSHAVRATTTPWKPPAPPYYQPPPSTSSKRPSLPLSRATPRFRTSSCTCSMRFDGLYERLERESGRGSRCSFRTSIWGMRRGLLRAWGGS